MKRVIPLITAVLISAGPACAESVIRYGISLADIPQTTGQPDRGAGAYQFTGYTIYDPLVAWKWMSPIAPAS
jgi:peptide/nickel transport system substrate-binding protein